MDVPYVFIHNPPLYTLEKAWYNSNMAKIKLTLPVSLAIFLSLSSFSMSKSYTVNPGSGQFIETEVKLMVDRTFSVYAADRAVAAYRLGLMGPRAVKAVPFLMRMLDDNLPVWCRYNGYGIWSSPGKEASRALALIGRPASGYLSLLVNGTHPYVFINPYMERNLRFTLSRITGKDHGTEFKKWSDLLTTQEGEKNQSGTE